jgi:hypothetical protein
MHFQLPLWCEIQEEESQCVQAGPVRIAARKPWPTAAAYSQRLVAQEEFE